MSWAGGSEHEAHRILAQRETRTYQPPCTDLGCDFITIFHHHGQPPYSKHALANALDVYGDFLRLQRFLE